MQPFTFANCVDSPQRGQVVSALAMPARRVAAMATSSALTVVTCSPRWRQSGHSLPQTVSGAIWKSHIGQKMIDLPMA